MSTVTFFLQKKKSVILGFIVIHSSSFREYLDIFWFMCISLFHFLFLKTHFCPGILYGIGVIYGEEGANMSLQYFFVPKNNILDTEMKTGK